MLIVLFALIIIGLIRLLLEVALRIDLNGKWYSFDPDIVFVMSVFPFYLCFFLAMSTDIVLKMMKIKAEFKKIFSLFFLLQIFHLIIPLFDYLGTTFHLANSFQPYLNCGACSLNIFSNATNAWQVLIILTPLIIFFTPPQLITLGITISWMTVAVIFYKHLEQEFQISLFKKIIIIFILFQIIYWPIYKYFVLFDGIFNSLTGIKHYNHYGYGFYFLTFALIGLAYYLKKINEKNN